MQRSIYPFHDASLDWLRSEPFILQRLKETYHEIPEKERFNLIYRRAPQVRYWFEQARSLYEESKNVGWFAKPTLLYYAAYALMRLFLLITDVDYPKRQEELAHGLAIKKLKPKRFVFNEDTIRVKREGTYPLYSLRRYQYATSGEIWKVQGLLEQIDRSKEYPHDQTDGDGRPLLLPYLMFLYYTSHLSRYDSERWAEAFQPETSSSLYVYIFFERLIPNMFHDLLRPFY